MAILKASAYAMTEPQLQTLRTAILAEPTLAADWAAGNDSTVAAFFNEVASPAFVVWKSQVMPSDYREALVWTEIDTRSVGQARIWEWMTMDNTLPIDPSRPNIISGINNAFAGAGAASTRNAMIALCKRNATKFEKLYATGTGSDASPATMALEGPCTSDIVYQARRLP